MKKQAGFVDPQAVILLFGGILILIVAALITNWSLAHWNVGGN